MFDSECNVSKRLSSNILTSVLLWKINSFKKNDINTK